ncbi:MAG: S-methyl-5-thioribose kinase [Mobilitalea sp.]
MNHVYKLKEKDEVIKYLNNKALLENDLFIIDEIGNGNMNYVYRIKSSDCTRSYILKYAANHTRISDDIMVSTDRIKIESKAILYLSKYVPDYVPHIYQFDEINNCILMEDYSDFIIVRDLLNNFIRIPFFADHISTYLVKGLFPYSELVLDNESKQNVINLFANPLCDITKTFVFTEPFMKNSNTNNIYEPNQSFIDKEVFQDTKLISEVVNLKKIYTNKKQALLHGDLHTGSIFSNEESIIVFDFEFAFYGPIGFDIGNLIANLIFSWLHTEANSVNSDYIYWIEETIINIVDLFIEKFICEWNDYESEKNIDHTMEVSSYLQEIIHDTASFAGVELIRRVVGIAHVIDITSIDSQEKRIWAERKAIQVAKYFILNKDRIQHGSDFIKVLRATK